jgi:hypothetical protein
MSININHATQSLRRVGQQNVRIVPMPGHSAVSGQHRIEIKEANADWQPLVEGLERSLADNIVQQAFNRVILG